MHHPICRSFLILGLVLTASAFARWGQIADAPAIQKNLTVKVRLFKDASYEQTSESYVQVRNEYGRQKFANLDLRYHSGMGELKVLSASTINAKGTEEVENDWIDDKPAPNQPDAVFGQERQVTIAFPKVEIGSVLYAKWKTKTTKVGIPKFYSYDCYFGIDRLAEKGSYEFVSDIPLFLAVNDPHKKLRISSTREGNQYRVSVEITSPIYEQVFDEKNAFLRRPSLTWVGVSTFRVYEELGTFGAATYQKLLAAPLPGPFQAMVNEMQAKEMEMGVNQINEVLARLATEMRYLRYQRALDAGVVPRSLEVIAQTKFGDCKDLSLTATALLRALGYEAQVAWIMRSNEFDGFLSPLPLFSSFNHAIVRVRSKGQVYWIDPTNPVSFAQGIPEDIAGRPALVLDEQGPRLENVPEDGPSRSQIERTFRIRPNKQGDGTLQVNVSWKGRAAFPMAENLLRASVQTLVHSYIDQIAEGRLVTSNKVESLPKPSRFVNDISLNATVNVKNLTLQTTAGQAYRLDSTPLKPLSEIDAASRVSDLFLTAPITEKSVYELEDIQPVGNIPLNCVIDSPWVSMERHTKKRATSQGLLVEDRLEIKKPYIRAAEIRSRTFTKFQEEFRKCFYDTLVIFKQAGAR